MWNEKHRYVVAGRYNDNSRSGGIDGFISDKWLLKEYLFRILMIVKPEALIFEGIMYGITYKFGYEVYKICESLGYEYVGLQMDIPLENALTRIYERNGGKGINVESLQKKIQTSYSAYLKLKGSGVHCEMVDTSKIAKDRMYQIIERVL